MTDAKLVNEMGYTRIDSLTRGISGGYDDGDDYASMYPFSLSHAQNSFLLSLLICLILNL